MYAYYTIIQKCISNEQDILFIHKNTDDNEIFKITHELCKRSISKYNCENISHVFNKTNIYLFLIKLIQQHYTEFKNDTYLVYDFIIEKYEYLKSIYFENVFFNDTNKELFLSSFSKIQKTYFGFLKLAKIYKFNKAVVKINTDLYINDLDETMKHVFVLYENNSKYLFSSTDLVNIITNSLSNTYMFFSEPLKPKNPYNNLPFNNSTMYNIYFFFKSRPFIMPQLFEQYFMCDFDLVKFRHENESLIRDFSIKRFVYSSNTNILYDKVIEMINDLKKRDAKYKKFMAIHKGFPKNKLVNIMRPYLHLYYLYKYYIAGTEKKNDAILRLTKKFDLFIRFNPQFGRKIIKVIKMPTRKVTVEYNDKHMDFYKKYPASAFPKLPIIRDIDIEPHSLLYRINQNILQRLSRRARNTEIVYSQFIYNTDSRESSNRADSSGESSIIENTNNHYENEEDEEDEDEQDEEDEDEEDEEQEYEYVEEDTTDGSDSVS